MLAEAIQRYSEHVKKLRYFLFMKKSREDSDNTEIQLAGVGMIEAIDQIPGFLTQCGIGASQFDFTRIKMALSTNIFQLVKEPDFFKDSAHIALDIIRAIESSDMNAESRVAVMETLEASKKILLDIMSKQRSISPTHSAAPSMASFFSANSKAPASSASSASKLEQKLNDYVGDLDKYIKSKTSPKDKIEESKLKTAEEFRQKISEFRMGVIGLVDLIDYIDGKLRDPLAKTTYFKANAFGSNLKKLFTDIEAILAKMQVNPAPVASSS